MQESCSPVIIENYSHSHLYSPMTITPYSHHSPTRLALAVASTLVVTAAAAQQPAPSTLPEIKVVGKAEGGYVEQATVSAMKSDMLAPT